MIMIMIIIIIIIMIFLRFITHKGKILVVSLVAIIL